MSNPEFRMKKFLAQAVFEKAGAVVPVKDLIPVLKSFLVEVTENQVTVVATDMELSVVCHTTLVDVERPGKLIIPAKKLLDILREAAGGDVTISVEDGVAQVSAGGAVWSLRLADDADYPAIPDVSAVEWSDVSRKDFLTAVLAVQGAAARDMTRPSLMMLDVRDGKITACDGVRFKQTTVPGVTVNLQIPVGAVGDLVKLLRDTEVDTVSVGETEFHLVFKVGSDVFVSSKLMAEFPDVEAILLRPALANQHPLGVVRADLISAVRRVRINADEDSSAISLKLSEGSCTVTSRDKYGNVATENVAAVWEGTERSLAVNHVFLLDMLETYSGTSCQFMLGEDTKSKKSPIVLTDEHTTAILNQMRVDW